jgi:DNA-binding NtrC family response regulator
VFGTRGKTSFGASSIGHHNWFDTPQVNFARDGTLLQRWSCRPVVQNTGTVLFVDDEWLVSWDTCELLRDAGYTVHEAEHAEAAISPLAGPAFVIDVLITDLRMPGMYDGLALALHVSKSRLEVRIMIASGNEQPTNMLPGWRYLQKPCDSGALLQNVRELMPPEAT